MQTNRLQLHCRTGYISASNSPDVTLFTRLRSNWDLMIPHDSWSPRTCIHFDQLIITYQHKSCWRRWWMARVPLLMERFNLFEMTAITYLTSLSKDEVTFRQPGAPPPQGPFEQDRLSAASRLLFVRCTSEHLGLEPWAAIAKRTRYMPSPSSQLMHISNRWLLYKKTAYSRKV